MCRQACAKAAQKCQIRSMSISCGDISLVFLVGWRCLAPRPGACVHIWDALWQLLSQSNSALHLDLHLIFSTYRIFLLPSSQLLSVRMCHSKFRCFSTCCPSRTIGSMRFFVISSPFGWVTRISLSANISYGGFRSLVFTINWYILGISSLFASRMGVGYMLNLKTF